MPVAAVTILLISTIPSTILLFILLMPTSVKYWSSCKHQSMDNIKFIYLLNVPLFYRDFSVGINCSAKDSDFRANSGPYRSGYVASNVLILQLNSILSTYRPGFVVLELPNLNGGSYTITPSTFYPSKEGPYIMKVLSDCVMTLSDS